MPAFVVNVIRSRLLARPSFARAVEEARPFALSSPWGRRIRIDSEATSTTSTGFGLLGS